MSKKNPKIEFYKIHLNPMNKNSKTKIRDVFRDIFISLNPEYNSDTVSTVEDSKLQSSFFQYFFNKINSKFNTNQRKRKAFYAKTNIIDGIEKTPIKISLDDSLLDGLIRGGDYDTGKKIGDMSNPTEETPELDKANIILDDFYFCLHTPLNKDVAILVLQSYTKDQISDIFTPFVTKLFKRQGVTFNAKLEKFMPQIIQDEFKTTSIVEKFRFNNKLLISQMENGISYDKAFNVQVEIKPVEKDINLGEFQKWKRKVGESIFNLPNNPAKELNTFNEQIGYLKPNDGISKPTPFELNADKIKINATIYLEKYVPLDLDSGVPKWDKLEEYVKKTLFEVVSPEVYPEDYINED
jgi:hypothetical protein